MSGNLNLQQSMLNLHLFAICFIYRAVIESVLTFSLIVWFGSSTAQQRSQINNITRVASKIIGYDLPTIDEIYVSRLQKKGLKILKDPLHPARHLFTPLPSGRRLSAIKKLSPHGF